jgi:hypothetical protein
MGVGFLLLTLAVTSIKIGFAQIDAQTDQGSNASPPVNSEQQFPADKLNCHKVKGGELCDLATSGSEFVQRRSRYDIDDELGKPSLPSKNHLQIPNDAGR